MAGKGNPKGSNGGGGRIKGQKRGETKQDAMERMGIAAVVEAKTDPRYRKGIKDGAAAAAKVAIPEERPRSSGVKLGKEIMSEGANYFFGLAAKYQSGAAEANETKFEKYLALACKIAAGAAPYESQRLNSMTVMQVPLDLSRLTTEELAQLEHLHAKATVADGDQGGAEPSVH